MPTRAVLASATPKATEVRDLKTRRVALQRLASGRPGGRHELLALSLVRHCMPTRAVLASATPKATEVKDWKTGRIALQRLASGRPRDSQAMARKALYADTSRPSVCDAQGHGSQRLEDTPRRLAKARERPSGGTARAPRSLARKALHADTSRPSVCDAQGHGSRRLEDTPRRLAKARERGQIADWQHFQSRISDQILRFTQHKISNYLH